MFKFFLVLIVSFAICSTMAFADVDIYAPLGVKCPFTHAKATTHPDMWNQEEPLPVPEASCGSTFSERRWNMTFHYAFSCQMATEHDPQVQSQKLLELQASFEAQCQTWCPFLGEGATCQTFVGPTETFRYNNGKIVGGQAFACCANRNPATVSVSPAYTTSDNPYGEGYPTEILDEQYGPFPTPTPTEAPLCSNSVPKALFCSPHTIYVNGTPGDIGDFQFVVHRPESMSLDAFNQLVQMQMAASAALCGNNFSDPSYHNKCPSGKPTASLRGYGPSPRGSEPCDLYTTTYKFEAGYTCD